MLLSLLITDVITVKEQVYVLVLCHLHPVAVYGDTELLIAAFRPIGFDFLRGLVSYHAIVEALRAILALSASLPVTVACAAPIPAMFISPQIWFFTISTKRPSS